LPQLNVTPLTGINYGAKFPFGIFTWVTSGISGWGGAAAAPAFDLPLLGIGATHPIHVDLAILNPVMPLFREALLFAATFGFLWFLATSFLGFKEWGTNEQGQLF
jgi:hypothetical protein